MASTKPSAAALKTAGSTPPPKKFSDWDIVRDADGMPIRMELRAFGYVAQYRVRWINPRSQIRERWFLDYNAAINFAARFPYERVVVEGPLR